MQHRAVGERRHRRFPLHRRTTSMLAPMPEV
jgi:hypothetical protein